MQLPIECMQLHNLVFEFYQQLAHLAKDPTT